MGNSHPDLAISPQDHGTQNAEPSSHPRPSLLPSQRLSKTHSSVPTIGLPANLPCAVSDRVSAPASSLITKTTTTTTIEMSVLQGGHPFNRRSCLPRRTISPHPQTNRIGMLESMTRTLFGGEHEVSVI